MSTTPRVSRSTCTPERRGPAAAESVGAPSPTGRRRRRGDLRRRRPAGTRPEAEGPAGDAAAGCHRRPRPSRARRLVDGFARSSSRPPGLPCRLGRTHRVMSLLPSALLVVDASGCREAARPLRAPRGRARTASSASSRGVKHAGQRVVSIRWAGSDGQRRRSRASARGRRSVMGTLCHARAARRRILHSTRSRVIRPRGDPCRVGDRARAVDFRGSIRTSPCFGVP